MSKINVTYERISRYLKGILSNRERHDLERDMMQDVFDEEAFEGLNLMNAGELESDMTALANRLDQRIHQPKKNSRLLFYRIAAGFIFIAGLGTILYLFLKSPSPEMITQQVRQEERSAPQETKIPSAPVLPETLALASEVKDKGIVIQKSEGKERSVQFKTEAAEEMELESDEEMEAIEMAAPVASAQYPKQPVSSDSLSFSPADQYISGRVLGINRQALAGVAIVEQGTAYGTVTDANGNFRLNIRDTAAKLKLSYVGYQSVQLPARELAGKEIFLDEDLIALNEVVVIGYGTQYRSRSDKAAMETNKKARVDKSTPYNYSKPVPPGGTLPVFEKWVESRIDTEKFMDLLPGKYKIQVNILVNSDGTLGPVTVKNDVPGIVAEEYKRVVSQSLAWLPATMDSTAVEAEVQIIFLLTVE